MQKYILFIIVIFFSLSLKSQISRNEILKASEGFIYENDIFKGYSHKNTVYDLKFDNKTVAYLVKLQPEGYIIFTSSKKLDPVFSYSEKGDFDIIRNKENPVFNTFLHNIAKEIQIAEEKSSDFIEIINKNKKSWKKLLSENKTRTFDYQYGYYIKDLWGGVNCWDNEGNFIYPSSYYTPNHYSPGCVAISASQILHYYEWPPIGVGSHTDYDNNGSSQGSYYARFGSMHYDWKNMLDDYQGEYSSITERKAVGRLMYHVGVAVDMDYEDIGSTSHANRVPNAFQSYFRTTGHYQTWAWANFGIRLRENLRNKMPVEFGVKADNGDEHACICDGYRYNDGETKYYHLNMGWWNWYGGNAWYNIYGNFNAIGYTSITGGVFDILPKPMMNKVVRTSDYQQFIVNWHASKNLNWESFQLQESYNNGAWTTIENAVTDTLYMRTVSQDGIYKYRVQAKVGGNFYSDNYSNVGVVQVGKTIFLDFDGNDSFFVSDNQYNNLDVNENWTYEAWVKVDSYSDGDWNVILDRKTVFSLYLIDDADADFAVRFATRDGSGNIVNSLRSDNSDVNLELNKWFHVAISRDGTTARLFLNGKLIEESTSTDFVLTNSTNALNVGARYWGSYSRYLNGQIDEIRLSSTGRYTENFCPVRFNLFEDDDYTRLLLNLQYGTGTGLFESSYHFLGITMQDSPNMPNWQTENTPIVNIQPISQAGCSGNLSFTLDASNSDNYQWQFNNGTGFANFTDGANVTGATTNTININDITEFAGDNKIRCILSNATVPYTCSDEAIFSAYDNCTIWNGTTWSNGLPEATKSAIIDANYTADHFFTTKNLKINENDTLFIDENYTLNVEGDFINNGTLFLKSENADQISGTFIHSGEVLNYGNMVAQKTFGNPYTESSENNFYFSNPTNTENTISEIFENIPEIYQNEGAINDWTLLDNTDIIEKGKAYLYNANVQDKATFEGLLNSENQKNIIKIYRNDDFYEFLPNPYPSYINWNETTAWTKENISSNLYTYDIYNNGNSKNYSVWDGTVGIHSGNGFIKPMESYLVLLDDYRANVELTTEAQVSTEDINSANATPENLIRFQFENSDATIYDEAVLYFADEDKKAEKVLPLSENKFYTFFPSLGKKYAICKINNPNKDTLISVGFKTSNVQEITFRVTEFTLGETTVKLKDLWTGDVMTITNGSTYTFTASSSEPDNRFKLLFGTYTSVKDVENEQIKTWSNGKLIFIENSKNENLKYSIYDVSGRLLLKNESSNSFIEIKNLKTGINILKIQNQNQTQSQKFSIIN